MLEFKNINAFYGKKQVLFDISLKIEKSSVNAVLGLNGSGKSTLFSLIFNQIQYNGNIYFKNKDIKEYSFKERAKNISFLPQSLTASELTVLDLICLGRNPYLSFNGKFGLEDEKLINQAINKTNLQEYKNTKLSELSGGERQKAYLAMVLAQNTDFYIFDEPLSFIDPAFSAIFLSVIKELKEKGKTVVIIMHDVNKALDIADNILFLHGGKKKFFGSKEEFTKTNLLEEHFNLLKYQVNLNGKPELIYK